MPIHNRSFLPSRVVRICLLSAALVGVGTLAACGDPYTLKATYPNEAQTFVVHALSGTPTYYSSGLALLVRQVTRVDGSLSFDIAFDLDQNNDVVILPVKMVGRGIGQSRLVGLKAGGGTFDQVISATTTGYRYDSVLVVRKGETFVVQSQTATCANSITPYIYSKASIDSVDTIERKIYGRLLVNLNCGFRGLATGLPLN